MPSKWAIHADLAKVGHNRPTITIELNRELAEFLIYNCESNLRLSMAMLQSSHDGTFELTNETVRELVKLSENFRELRRLVQTKLDEP